MNQVENMKNTAQKMINITLKQLEFKITVNYLGRYEKRGRKREKAELVGTGIVWVRFHRWHTSFAPPPTPPGTLPLPSTEPAHGSDADKPTLAPEKMIQHAYDTRIAPSAASRSRSSSLLPASTASNQRSNQLTNKETWFNFEANYNINRIWFFIVFHKLLFKKKKNPSEVKLYLVIFLANNHKLSPMVKIMNKLLIHFFKIKNFGF